MVATQNFKKDSPIFYGMNYSLQKNQMKIHLMCLGGCYWDIVEKDYQPPQNRPLTQDEQKEVEENIKSKEALINALKDEQMANVMELNIAHKLWRSLRLYMKEMIK